MTRAQAREAARIAKAKRDTRQRIPGAAWRPELYWRDNVPEEVRTIMEPLLDGVLWLVPTWCHELQVSWDDEEIAGDLRISAQPDYRFAVLHICPSWLSQTAAIRRHEVRHEMVHLAISALPDTVVNPLLERMKAASPEMAEALSEQWRQAVEGATEDLTRALGARGI